MCLVRVEKNSFYRKVDVPSSGAVTLHPRFKDLAFTGSEAVANPDDNDRSSFPRMTKLESGMNPTRMVVSGSVPTTPSYGSGKLKGGYFRTYASGIALSGTNTLPVMEMYKVEEGAGPEQGQFTMSYRDGSTANSERGSKIYVMSSYIDGNTSWLEENFDGADKSLGEFQMLGDQGTATLSLEDAYLESEQAIKLLFQGGDNFAAGGGDAVIRENFEAYFSDPNNKNQIYVRPMKRNRMKGLWTSTNDRRDGKSTWSVYKPYWKWDKIKGFLNYKRTTAATDDIDAAKDATENNTIFSHIAVQGNYGNVFTAGEDAPLLESVCELSTEKKVSGGQSLRFYHL